MLFCEITLTFPLIGGDCFLKEYVVKDDYLMGRTYHNFKAQLTYVVNNYLEIKTRKHRQSYKNSYKKPKQQSYTPLPEINTTKIDELLKSKETPETKMKKDMMARWGKPTYISWLSKLSFDKCEGDTIYFKVESEFLRDEIDKLYGIGLSIELCRKHFLKIRVCRNSS